MNIKTYSYMIKPTCTESGDNLSSSERFDTGDASDDFDGRQICLLVIGIL